MRIQPKAILIVTAAIALLVGTAAIADSTGTLPKGRSAITFGYVTDGLDREYDSDGDDRELGYYLNTADVTEVGELIIWSSLPPALQVAIVPQDVLTSVELKAQARVDVEILPFSYNYGLTDNWMVGVAFPYYTMARTDIKFGVDVQPSNTATFIPVGPGVSLADMINTLDGKAMAQDYLKEELGYDKIKPWEGPQAIGDIVLSTKYRFLDMDMFKAAAGGWLSLPTGTPDDERSLTDIAYGSGSYDVAAFGMVDVVPIKWLIINFTGRYVYTFPYQRGVFVIDKSTAFGKDDFATDHKNGMYNSGDWYELETEIKFELADYVEIFGGYFYKQSIHDTIDGDLMSSTDEMVQQYFYGLNINSIEAYKNDESRLPIAFSIAMEPVFDGVSVERTKRVLVLATIIF